jgi:hypothetical protein
MVLRSVVSTNTLLVNDQRFTEKRQRVGGNGAGHNQEMLLRGERWHDGVLTALYRERADLTLHLR